MLSGSHKIIAHRHSESPLTQWARGTFPFSFIVPVDHLFNPTRYQFNNRFSPLATWAKRPLWWRYNGLHYDYIKEDDLQNIIVMETMKRQKLDTKQWRCKKCFCKMKRLQHIIKLEQQIPWLPAVTFIFVWSHLLSSWPDALETSAKSPFLQTSS